MIAINIQMPKSCGDCPCYGGAVDGKCRINNEHTMIHFGEVVNKKPGWCPLLKVDEVRFKQIVDKSDLMYAFYDIRHFRQQAASAFAKHIFSEDDLVKTNLTHTNDKNTYYPCGTDEYSATAFIVRREDNEMPELRSTDQ